VIYDLLPSPSDGSSANPIANWSDEVARFAGAIAGLSVLTRATRRHSSTCRDAGSGGRSRCWLRAAGGAVHCGRIRGFAFERLATRIDDAKRRVIVPRLLEGIEVGAFIPYKADARRGDRGWASVKAEKLRGSCKLTDEPATLITGHESRLG